MGIYRIGIDVGGTKILGGLFDENDALISRMKIKTLANEGQDSILERIENLISRLVSDNKLAARDISAVCLAVPGQADYEKGIIISAPNIMFRNVNIKHVFEQKLKIRFLLENDVNCGVYGEFVSGAGRGFKHITGVFPGTGIGGGFILDGRLYRGATGNAGEIGHMMMMPHGPLCGCGREGCFEALASRTAIARESASTVLAGRGSKEFRDTGSDVNSYKSGVIVRLSSDPEMMRILERNIAYLGQGIANIVNIMNPELIIIGGGIAEKLGSWYVDAIAGEVRKNALSHLSANLEFRIAQLGDTAAIAGAAALIAARDGKAQ